MGRLAERHGQPAWTSGGNNFRVRLLEKLHCHTSTHEQLLHEGCAGIAFRAVAAIISEITSSANYRKFRNHAFGGASVPPLNALKNVSSRFTARIFSRLRRFFSSLVFSRRWRAASPATWMLP